MPPSELDEILRRNPDLRVERIQGKLVDEPSPLGAPAEITPNPDIPASGPGTWKVNPDMLYPSRPDFRSKTEGRAWDTLWGHQDWLTMQYEPLVFHLPSGNYTPDIGIWTVDGFQIMVEVKSRMGFKGHGSGRSARRAMKEAAALFGFAYYFIAMIERRSGGWKYQLFHHNRKVSKPTGSLLECVRQYGELDWESEEGNDDSENDE